MLIYTWEFMNRLHLGFLSIFSFHWYYRHFYLRIEWCVLTVIQYAHKILFVPRDTSCNHVRSSGSNKHTMNTVLIYLHSCGPNFEYEPWILDHILHHIYLYERLVYVHKHITSILIEDNKSVSKETSRDGINFTFMHKG